MTVRPRIASASKLRTGSVLVIVLWIALGLVTIALYFANTMTLELRASENNAAALAADQAIEGAARYVASVLSTLATNGAIPDVTQYYSEAVPVGDARFWLIGRTVEYELEPDQVFFGLIDEGAKINVNTASLETLKRVTNVTEQLAANIFDWRSTNGAVSEGGDGPTVYSQLEPSYMIKTAAFETLDELKLVYPADTALLYGEDRNLNGALDPGEADTNRNNFVDPGLFEYLSVFTREANLAPDGSQRVDVSNLSATNAALSSILETNLTAQRAQEVMARLGLTAASGGQPGGSSGQQGGGRGEGSGQGGGQAAAGSTSTTNFASPLAFYLASGMTADEFAVVGNFITATNAEYIYGRVNINTAPPAVLACLPGVSMDVANQLANYRRQAPDTLTSIAWVVEALGADNQTVLQALAETDCITTRSYQFTADVAAVGPHGRGYRRVRFVFDVTSGTPEIVYRQDLGHLGWALGVYARETWTARKDLP